MKCVHLMRIKHVLTYWYYHSKVNCQGRGQKQQKYAMICLNLEKLEIFNANMSQCMRWDSIYTG